MQISQGVAVCYSENVGILTLGPIAHTRRDAKKFCGLVYYRFLSNLIHENVKNNIPILRRTFGVYIVKQESEK